MGDKPNVFAQPIVGTNQSGKITGVGGNVSASNNQGFVSAGAYKPAGSPATYDASIGKNINSSTTVYASGGGNAHHVNVGIGIKKNF